MSQWNDSSSASTTDAAKSEAAGVAQNAGAAAQQVAGTAQEQAKQVASEASNQAKELAGQLKSQVNEQAGSQRDRLVDTLRSLTDELQQIGSGQGGQSGMATDLARTLSERTQSAAGFLDGRQPSDLLNEVTKFARQRPGVFLLGAAAAGLVAGRLTRGVSAARSDDTAGTSAVYPVTAEPMYGDATVDAGQYQLTPPVVEPMSTYETAPSYETAQPYQAAQPYESAPPYETAPDYTDPVTGRPERPGDGTYR